MTHDFWLSWITGMITGGIGLAAGLFIGYGIGSSIGKFKACQDLHEIADSVRRADSKVRNGL